MVQNRSGRNGRMRKFSVTKDARELRIWKIIKVYTLFNSLALVEEDDKQYRRSQFLRRPLGNCQTLGGSFLTPPESCIKGSNGKYRNSWITVPKSRRTSG